MNIQHQISNNQQPAATSKANHWLTGVRCSVFGVAKRKPASGAFSLIEMLVYFSVLMILLGVGYGALHRSMDSSAAFRRSTDDIANALHAGDNWRADVRGARGQIGVQTNADEQILRLQRGPRGDISYRYATNTVFRRAGSNGWSEVLAHVRASTFEPNPHMGVAAWRWELELLPRAKKPGRIQPLFTFTAVPTGASLK